MNLGRNSKRTRERHARNFGAEADAVRGLRCLCNDQLCDELVAAGNSDTEDIESRWCAGGIEPAHVASRGASGGRFDVVPLCKNHHAEQHQHGVKTFAAKYGFDLRAEADLVALEHERPLGIRGLADRKAIDAALSNFDPEGQAATVDVTGFEPLDTYETDALRGWTQRVVDASPATTRTGKAWALVDALSSVTSRGEIYGFSEAQALDLGAWACGAGWPS